MRLIARPFVSSFNFCSGSISSFRHCFFRIYSALCVCLLRHMRELCEFLSGCINIVVTSLSDSCDAVPWPHGLSEIVKRKNLTCGTALV